MPGNCGGLTTLWNYLLVTEDHFSNSYRKGVTVSLTEKDINKFSPTHDRVFIIK